MGNFKNETILAKFNEVYNLFKNNKTGSSNLDTENIFVSVQNAILFRRFNYDGINQEVILYKTINNTILGNSSFLPQLSGIGENYSRVSCIQTYLNDKETMLPFAVLKQANLFLDNYIELDKGLEETIKLKNHVVCSEIEFTAKQNTELISKKFIQKNWKDESLFNFDFYELRHFMGARLFKVNDFYFLLDVDRNELKHGIINPFLVQLTSPVDTIAEAYESLKPELVKQAEQANQSVKRQGEWFFIKPSVIPLISKTLVKPGILRAGNNRPNDVEQYVELDSKFYVKGTVSHRGREHKELLLDTWYQAVPNTSTTSWQITGDLD